MAKLSKQEKTDIIMEKVSEMMPESADFGKGVNARIFLNPIKAKDGTYDSIVRDRDRSISLYDAASRPKSIDSLDDMELHDLYATLLTDQMWDSVRVDGKKGELKLPTPFDYSFIPVFGGEPQAEQVHVDRILVTDGFSGKDAQKTGNNVEVYLLGKNAAGEEVNPSLYSMSFEGLASLNGKLDNVVADIYDLNETHNLTPEAIARRDELTAVTGDDFHWAMDDGEEEHAIPIGDGYDKIVQVDVIAGRPVFTAYYEQSDSDEYVPLKSLTKEDWDNIIKEAPALKELVAGRPQNYVSSKEPVIEDLMTGLNNKTFNPYWFRKDKSEKDGKTDIYNIRYDGIVYNMAMDGGISGGKFHEINIYGSNTPKQTVTVSSTTWEALAANIADQQQKQDEIAAAYDEGKTVARDAEKESFIRLFSEGRASAENMNKTFASVLGDGRYVPSDEFTDKKFSLRYTDPYDADEDIEIWKKAANDDGYARQVRDDYKKFNDTLDKQKAGLPDHTEMYRPRSIIEEMFPETKGVERRYPLWTQMEYIPAGTEEAAELDVMQEEGNTARMIDTARVMDDPDREIDLAETHLMRPDHYSGDDILAREDGYAVVVNNSTGGDYSLWREIKYPYGELYDYLENRGIIEMEGLSDLSYSHEYSDDVKKIIHDAAVRKEEDKLVTTLGEGFYWQNPVNSDLHVGWPGNSDEITITHMQVRDGHLKLYSGPCLPGQGFEQPLDRLNQNNWQALETFAATQAEKKAATYDKVKEVWNVYGTRNGKTELVREGMSSASSSSYISKHYGKYDNLFAEKAYVIGSKEDKKGYRLSGGRWDFSEDPEKQMCRDFGKTLEAFDRRYANPKEKIPEENFVPDRADSTGRALMLSVISHERGYDKPVFLSLEEMYRLGIGIEHGAEAVTVPKYVLDGKLTTEEVVNVADTNLPLLAAKDPHMAEIYSGLLDTAEKEKVRALGEGQLDFINRRLEPSISYTLLKSDAAYPDNVKEFLKSANDDFIIEKNEEREAKEAVNAVDTHIEKHDARFTAGLPAGTTSRDEIILGMEHKGSLSNIYIHPNGSGTIHYSGADKSAKFSGKKGWYAFASTVLDAPERTVEPENQSQKDGRKQDEGKSRGLRL